MSIEYAHFYIDIFDLCKSVFLFEYSTLRVVSIMLHHNTWHHLPHFFAANFIQSCISVAVI